MFPGRYAQIFGLGERLGCILNFSHSFDAIGRIFDFASMSITLAQFLEQKLFGLARAPADDVAAMAWSSTPSSRRRTKDYLPATQPEESITPQSSRRPNELFASDDV